MNNEYRAEGLVILENYAAHKHPKVRAWLGRHPSFVFHFVSTVASPHSRLVL